MSAIIDFYKGQAPDAKGRMLCDIQKWNYSKLEDVHTYIQWLFPLKTRSNYNKRAPILTDDDIREFKDSSEIRENMIKSFALMMSFYGFSLVTNADKIIIEKSNNFKEISENWISEYNHNFIRITRILKSLKLLNLDSYAEAFFGALDKLYTTDYKKIIDRDTYQHWKNAAK